MYVEKLTISNFRCFERADVELNYPGRADSPAHANVNLFVGGNGSGKSSFFKALALGVLAPIMQSSGLNAEYFVRRKPDGNQRTILIKCAGIVPLKLDAPDTDTCPIQEYF